MSSIHSESEKNGKYSTRPGGRGVGKGEEEEEREREEEEEHFETHRQRVCIVLHAYGMVDIKDRER